MQRAAKKNAWCFLHWDAALEKNCLYSGFLIRPQYSEHVRFTVQFSSHSKPGASICGSLSLNVWRHTHVMIIWLHTHRLPTFRKAPSNYQFGRPQNGSRICRPCHPHIRLNKRFTHQNSPWFVLSCGFYPMNPQKNPKQKSHYIPLYKSPPNRWLWECNGM